MPSDSNEVDSQEIEASSSYPPARSPARSRRGSGAFDTKSNLQKVPPPPPRRSSSTGNDDKWKNASLSSSNPDLFGRRYSSDRNFFERKHLVDRHSSDMKKPLPGVGEGRSQSIIEAAKEGLVMKQSPKVHREVLSIWEDMQHQQGQMSHRSPMPKRSTLGLLHESPRKSPRIKRPTVEAQLSEGQIYSNRSPMSKRSVVAGSYNRANSVPTQRSNDINHGSNYNRKNSHNLQNESYSRNSNFNSSSDLQFSVQCFSHSMERFDDSIDNKNPMYPDPPVQEEYRPDPDEETSLYEDSFNTFDTNRITHRDEYSDAHDERQPVNTLDRCIDSLLCIFPKVEPLPWKTFFLLASCCALP